ncbi:hypothetical protein ANCCAN_18338 [Ancylostoma caninum]|uniref:Peptidase A1 domain-containing protein n=1 Tax=Ancylostoma caninum TaxID=29170 RepID=A0A368FXR1_ANCCA|nr:hypothetical protein ANCCAN_18338 [Ancylostoma caninum]
MGEENVYGGRITYGGLDIENCEPHVVYEPVTEPSYWQFKMKRVSIGTFSSSTGWLAASDTSGNLIAGPPAIASAIAIEAGAKVS